MSNPSTSTPQTPVWTRGDRLRKALRTAGIEVNEMSAVLGVSRTTVSNYLADRTNPSRGVLIAWALRCGVPFGWLNDGDDTGPSDPATEADALTRWSHRLAA